MAAHRFRRDARHQVRRLGDRVADEVRFLKSWASRPLTTGAVTSSGRALARAMASRIDPAWPGVILELGPGTGSVSAALLARGVPAERLVAIEYNGDFAAHLGRRFPGVRIIQGDAYALAPTLALHGVGQVAAVVSSLPLFSRPPLQRHDLVRAALDLLPAGRPMVQFSYALVPPVPVEAGRWTLDASDWVLMNLPPARVWTYRSVSPG